MSNILVRFCLFSTLIIGNLIATNVQDQIAITAAKQHSNVMQHRTLNVSKPISSSGKRSSTSSAFARSKRIPIPKLPSFEGIYGCQKISEFAFGSYAKLYLVKMVNFRKNQLAALKIFDGSSEYSNELACAMEWTTLRLIASYEMSTGTNLHIAHIRKDIAGVIGARLMLEYIDGVDMFNLNLEHLPFALLINFVATMMKQISDVLQKLHSWNIYHNDIKPENIIFEPANSAFYLVDFGVSVLLDLVNQTDYYFWTTLGYMSPFHLDIMRNSKVDNRHIYQYVLKNDEMTQQEAVNAEFYSLGVAAIVIIGNNCMVNNALCMLAQRVSSIQQGFTLEEEKTFVKWSIQEIEIMLLPYWREIQFGIKEYVQKYPNENQKLLSLITEWVLMPDDYFS